MITYVMDIFYVLAALVMLNFIVLAGCYLAVSREIGRIKHKLKMHLAQEDEVNRLTVQVAALRKLTKEVRENDG